MMQKGRLVTQDRGPVLPCTQGQLVPQGPTAPFPKMLPEPVNTRWEFNRL